MTLKKQDLLGSKSTICWWYNLKFVGCVLAGSHPATSSIAHKGFSLISSFKILATNVYTLSSGKNKRQLLKKMYIQNKLEKLSKELEFLICKLYKKSHTWLEQKMVTTSLRTRRRHKPLLALAVVFLITTTFSRPSKASIIKNFNERGTLL